MLGVVVDLSYEKQMFHCTKLRLSETYSWEFCCFFFSIFMKYRELQYCQWSFLAYIFPTSYPTLECLIPSTNIPDTSPILHCSKVDSVLWTRFSTVVSFVHLWLLHCFPWGRSFCIRPIYPSLSPSEWLN